MEILPNEPVNRFYEKDGYLTDNYDNLFFIAGICHNLGKE